MWVAVWSVTILLFATGVGTASGQTHDAALAAPESEGILDGTLCYEDS